MWFICCMRLVFAGQNRPIDGDGNGISDFDICAYEAPPGFIWRVFSPLVR
jgi:hypothetical protein